MAPLPLTLSLALAHAAGISGYSGRQGAICNQCHTGGAAPSVFLMGPNTLMAGASATYTVIIQGGAGVRAGFNAAVTGGSLIAGAGTKVIGGEVTQSALGLFNGTTASFSFTLTAPASAGTVTLYAAGNSVDDNQSPQGDQAAAATLDITVTPGAAPMDAGMQSNPGAQPDSGTTTTPSSDGGTAGPPVDDGGMPSSAGGPAVVASKPKAAGPWAPGVVDGDFDAGCTAAGGLPLVLLAVLSLRRRARR